ncbi:MAG TPA: hypothetical protein VIJ15_14455 [Dermatophilaceae bacterium]
MKNRKTWIITGTIGILAAGTGAAFASQTSTTGDKDVARTTVTDNATTQAQTPGANTDDDAHGVTLTTPDPQATTTVAPTVAHADPAQPMPDSTITSVTLDDIRQSRDITRGELQTVSGGDCGELGVGKGQRLVLKSEVAL